MNTIEVLLVVAVLVEAILVYFTNIPISIVILIGVGLTWRHLAPAIHDERLLEIPPPQPSAMVDPVIHSNVVNARDALYDICLQLDRANASLLADAESTKAQLAADRAEQHAREVETVEFEYYRHNFQRVQKEYTALQQLNSALAEKLRRKRVIIERLQTGDCSTCPQIRRELKDSRKQTEHLAKALKDSEVLIQHAMEQATKVQRAEDEEVAAEVLRRASREAAAHEDRKRALIEEAAAAVEEEVKRAWGEAAAAGEEVKRAWGEAAAAGEEVKRAQGEAAAEAERVRVLEGELRYIYKTIGCAPEREAFNAKIKQVEASFTAGQHEVGVEKEKVELLQAEVSILKENLDNETASSERLRGESLKLKEQKKKLRKDLKESEQAMFGVAAQLRVENDLAQRIAIFKAAGGNVEGLEDQELDLPSPDDW